MLEDDRDFEVYTGTEVPVIGRNDYGLKTACGCGYRRLKTPGQKRAKCPNCDKDLMIELRSVPEGQLVSPGADEDDDVLE